MSGFKRATVSISDAEYQRLLEAELQMCNRDLQSTESQEQARQESRRALSQGMVAFEERQQQFQQAVLQHLTEQARSQEMDRAAALTEQQNQVVETINAYASGLWEHLQAIAQDRARLAQELFQQERRQRKAQMRALERTVNQAYQDRNQVAAHAADWLQTAQTMLDYVGDHYPHEQLAPGRLAQYAQRLEQARQSAGLGAQESALTLAQQTYFELSDLRIGLEARLTERNAWRSAALGSCRKVYSLLERSRRVRAIDLDGHEQDDEVDVNVWTGGKLDELERLLAYWNEQLAEANATLSSEDLERLAGQTLPGLQQRLHRLITDARAAFLGSQLRINIADLVVQALEEQGFALKKADYADGDYRAEYQAQMVALDGSEVCVRVAPAGRSVAHNQLFLESHDYNIRSEDELQQRAQVVAHSLQERGLQMEHFQSLPVDSIPAVQQHGQAARRRAAARA